MTFRLKFKKAFHLTAETAGKCVLKQSAVLNITGLLNFYKNRRQSGRCKASRPALEAGIFAWVKSNIYKQFQTKPNINFNKCLKNQLNKFNSCILDYILIYAGIQYERGFQVLLKPLDYVNYNQILKAHAPVAQWIEHRIPKCIIGGIHYFFVHSISL